MNYPKLFIILSLSIEKKNRNRKVLIPNIKIAPSWFSQDNFIKLFKFTLELDTKEKDKISEKINEKQLQINKALSENINIRVLTRELSNLQTELLRLQSITIIKDKNGKIIKNIDDLAISIYENFSNKYDIDTKRDKDNFRYIFKLKKF